MRGRAEIILMQSDDGSSMAKNANIIVTQIDRITKLIHSLLNLARGDRQQAVGSIDLWQVLNDVLELTGHEFNRHQIRSENLVPKNTMVRAAAGPLHQVLLNLLVNSIHAIQSAAKQGRATDHLVKIEASSRGGAVCVKVQDSGCGISDANMKKLFTPFFTTKEIGVGTGLGLATSYRLLESWGGSIQVQSQEGVGTTFSLFFQRPDTQA
jgi:C4-dicarboxylate-specific signal transduction histidine kinase